MAELRRTCCNYYLSSVRQWHRLLLGSDILKLMQALTLAIVTGPFRSPMQPNLLCELGKVTDVLLVIRFAYCVHTFQPGASIAKAPFSWTAVRVDYHFV